jgi:hypothetical protein
MGRREQIIPLDPPAARAPAVLERRGALERELADLKLQIAEKALDAYERRPDGRESLAALDAKIRACAFLIDCYAAAHELAARRDDQAIVTWKAEVQTLEPEEIVAGISKELCCHRCQPGSPGGCVITASAPHSGGVCSHPVRSRHLFHLDHKGKPFFPYRASPRASEIFDAACEKLNVRKDFA